MKITEMKWIYLEWGAEVLSSHSFLITGTQERFPFFFCIFFLYFF